MNENGGNLVQRNLNYQLREEWFEAHPEWRGILIPDPNNPARIRCIRCYPLILYPQFDNRSTMLARLEVIQRHIATQKHRRNIGNPVQIQLDRKIAIATLKLSAVFAEL